MDLVAFDFAGFSNKTSISVIYAAGASNTPVIPAADTSAPKIVISAIKVSKNADGTFTVILPLDDASNITGNITRNGVQLYQFGKGAKTADFGIDVLGPIVVTATDTAGNVLNQTIDLSVYLAH
ncbi:MAG: hypothetical protein WCJ45_05735 [bacterium]